LGLVETDFAFSTALLVGSTAAATALIPIAVLREPVFGFFVPPMFLRLSLTKTNWMRQGCEFHDHSVTLIFLYQLNGKSIPRSVEIHQITP
jgi:hypothetical protein